MARNAQARRGMVKVSTYKKTKDGKEIRPILFVTATGKSYMAGQVDGNMLERDGKPIPYSQL